MINDPLAIAWYLWATLPINQLSDHGLAIGRELDSFIGDWSIVTGRAYFS